MRCPQCDGTCEPEHEAEPDIGVGVGRYHCACGWSEPAIENHLETALGSPSRIECPKCGMRAGQPCRKPDIVWFYCDERVKAFQQALVLLKGGQK